MFLVNVLSKDKVNIIQMKSMVSYPIPESSL